jgi:NADH-quinone oxidoreductase subunit B
MEGLMLLQSKVGRERRPLTWVAGPQEVESPPMPSLRNLKRPERQKETVLRSPDEV